MNLNSTMKAFYYTTAIVAASTYSTAFQHFSPTGPNSIRNEGPKLRVSTLPYNDFHTSIIVPPSLLDLNSDAESFYPFPLEEEIASDDGGVHKMSTSSAMIGQSTTIETTNVSSPSKKKIPPLSTWKRRLMTKEDTFSLHKLSNIGATVSSAVIISTAVINGFDNTPDFLGPIAPVFLVSTFVQSISSIQMAYKFRADVAERNAFIGIALASFQLAFTGYWGSSLSAGTIFEGTLFSNAIQIPLEVLFLFTCFDGICRTPALLEMRKTKQEKENDEDGSIMQSAWAFFAYVSANVWAIPPIVANLLMVLEPTHDRQWLVQCLTDGTLPWGLDVSQHHWYYDTVIISECLSFIAFAVTLRDKKLISKAAECNSLGLLALTSLFFCLNWLGPIDLMD